MQKTGVEHDFRIGRDQRFRQGPPRVGPAGRRHDRHRVGRLRRERGMRHRVAQIGRPRLLEQQHAGAGRPRRAAQQRQRTIRLMGEATLAHIIARTVHVRRHVDHATVGREPLRIEPLDQL
jgi:hypothetical protein